jgi:hypothetical protein
MQMPTSRQPFHPPSILRMAPGFALAVAAACLPLQALAQDAEYALKAAFVFNFAVFTQWPDPALPAGSPLQLCAYGGNPMLEALISLNDKVVNGHRVQLRQLDAGAGARNCHVLVLDARDRERWSGLRRDLAGANVLTVADDRQIGASGAVLALMNDHSRIIFDADLEAARQAHLTLSSKLLRLARSAQ